MSEVSETIEKIAIDIQTQADLLKMLGHQPLDSQKVAEHLEGFAARLFANLPHADPEKKEESVETPAETNVGAGLGPMYPEVVEPQGKPVSPDAPEMVRGENPWHPLEIPECGIDFRRYYSHGCEVYICAWRNEEYRQSHVYEVRCRKLEDGQWRAVLSNDGRKLCAMAAPSRQLAHLMALGAMRAYLRAGHRKTIRRAAAKEQMIEDR